MNINLYDIINKHPKFSYHIFGDQIEFINNIKHYTIKVIVTQQGDLIIMSNDKYKLGWNILVDKQYFRQEEIEKDLQLFLGPLED
jgi:hypothetical protein